MKIGTHLDARLREGGPDEFATDIASAVMGLADAAIGIADLVALGALAGDLGGTAGAENADGDLQRSLDLIADTRFTNAMRKAPVAYLASEELDEVAVLDEAAPLAVAIDPLDGSSNIDSNVSIGTIFSVVAAHPPGAARPLDAFLQPGSTQLAAGFVVYGPQTALVLSIGRGVDVYILDRAERAFRLVAETVSVPRSASEFAINASNQRHWEEPMRTYVGDCLEGADGPLGRNFNMRWIASLVAEAYRILVRGGVFMYPGDRRKGYRSGRLRLVYEANPIAFVMEQAGGTATDTVGRILDLRPTSLHQRTPLVFGSAEQVERVGRYHTQPDSSAGRSPLFGRRGLLRA